MDIKPVNNIYKIINIDYNPTNPNENLRLLIIKLKEKNEKTKLQLKNATIGNSSHINKI